STSRRAPAGRSTRSPARRPSRRVSRSRALNSHQEPRMTFDRIAVLGGGAWGTALANVTARAGRKVSLWEFDAGHAEHLATKRETRFLPGVRIEGGIAVTRDLAEASRADAILLVVPAQAMRSVCQTLGATVAPGTPLIACAKGIEHGTRKF